jgi:drug/metabolite transporter (DMT)-like permease
MDEKVRKRIVMFYLAGIINAFLGLYVLIEGSAFLGRDTARLLALFFLVFAAVDFWFPSAIRKKWLKEQAQLEAQTRKEGVTRNER